MATKTQSKKSAPAKSAKSAKKAVAKKAVAERKEHLRITDGMRITLTKKGKEGSGRRSAKTTRTGKVYGYYKTGISVAAFLAKPDARRVDVLADVERGNITVSGK